MGGQFSDYNATGSPNWSAEAELIISWVGQLGSGVAIKYYGKTVLSYGT